MPDNIRGIDDSRNGRTVPRSGKKGEGKPTTKLRWGILATGWIADLLVQDLLANDKTVTAVGSRSIDKARDFAAKHGIPRSYGSYDELDDDPEVDVVYIATRHPFHDSAAELCSAAGKHVLAEKSFTLNGPEARHQLALSRKHDVVVLEAMWTRFLQHMVRLRQALASGLIGEIRTLVATHTQDLPDDPGHRINAPELGGGKLLDLGIYPVSFAFYTLGAPQTVVATARLRPTGADADAEVSVMFR